MSQVPEVSSSELELPPEVRNHLNYFRAQINNLRTSVMMSNIILHSPSSSSNQRNVAIATVARCLQEFDSGELQLLWNMRGIPVTQRDVALVFDLGDEASFHAVELLDRFQPTGIINDIDALPLEGNP